MSSIIIKDGIVITVNGEREIIEPGYVAIEGNEIISTGKMQDFDPNKKYDIEIEAKGKAVLPGFVNPHTHLATECFRGIVDLFPGTFFVFAVKDFFRDSDIYDLGMLGCLELIRFGTTCAGDNYQRSKHIARAASETGLRAVVSEQISQADLVTGIYPAIYKFQPENLGPQLKAAEALFEKWHGSNNGRISCAFGPHAPDTLTPEALRDIKEIAEQYWAGIMIHVAQGPREIQVMKLRHRMTPVQYLEKAGIMGPKTVAAHSIHLTADDIRIYRETGTHIAHCPSIFIKRGLKSPMIPWLKGGLTNIGLASDNIMHDQFEIMRMANYLAWQYVEQIEPDSLHLIPSAWETLEMATIRPARALGLDRQIGSIEAGKKADIIIVDMKKPHLVPNLDTLSTLIHYANGSDVETTIIDGKVVMDRRVIQTVDEGEVLQKGQSASESVWRGFAGKFPQFPDIARQFKYFS